MNRFSNFRLPVLLVLFACQLLSARLLKAQGIVMPQKPGAPQYTADQKAYLEVKPRVFATINSLRKTNLKQAIATCVELLQLDRNEFGIHSEHCAETLQLLSDLLWQDNQMEQSSIAKAEIANIRKALYGENDWRATKALWEALQWEMFSKSKTAGAEDRKFSALLIESDKHLAAGKYEAALAAAQEADQIVKNLYEPDHVPPHAQALRWVARAYKGQGKLQAADQVYAEISKVYEFWFGRQSPEAVMTLIDRARNTIDLDARERYYREAIAACEQMQAYDRSLLSDALLGMADQCVIVGRYAQGRELITRAIAIETELKGAESPTTMRMQLTAAQLDRELGKYSEAEPVFHKVVKYYDAAPQLYLALRIKAHVELADFYRATERYDLAERQFERALEIAREGYGEKHLEYAGVLNLLGYLQLGQQQFDKSLANFQKALAIALLQADRDSNDVLNPATGLSQAARSQVIELNAQGKAADARAKLRQVSEQLLPILGEAHSEAHQLRNALAVQDQLKQLSGDLAKAALEAERETLEYQQAFKANDQAAAEQHLRKAIELRATLGDQELLSVRADANAELGAMLYLQKKLSEAQPPLTIAVASYAELSKTQPPTERYAQALFNLGVTLESSNDPAGAIKLYNQSAEIYRRLGGRSINSAVALQLRIGECYWKLNDYDRAGSAFREYAAGVEAAYGKQSLRYSEALVELGKIDYRLGDLTRAKQRFDEAFSIREALQDGDSPSAWFIREWIAVCDSQMGDFEAAWAGLTAVAERARANQDEPRLAHFLEELASLDIRNQRYDRAEPLITEAVELRLRTKADPSTVWTAWLIMNSFFEGRRAQLVDEGKFAEVRFISEKALAEYAKHFGEQGTWTETLKAGIEVSKQLVALSPEQQQKYREAQIKVRAARKHRASSDPAIAAAAMEAADELRQLFGDKSIPVAEALSAAASCQTIGRLQYYELCHRIVEIYTAALGPDNIKTVMERVALGTALEKLGRYREAFDQLSQVLPCYQQHAAELPTYAMPALQVQLAKVHLKLNDIPACQRLLAEAEPVLSKHQSDSGLVDTWLDLLGCRAEFALRLGNAEESTRLAKLIYDRALRNYGAESITAIQAANMLGTHYVNSRRGEEAQPYFERAAEGLRKTGQEKSADYARAIMGLAIVQELKGNFDQASSLIDQSIALLAGQEQESLQTYMTALQRSCQINCAAGKFDEAEAIARKSLEFSKQHFGPESREYHIDLKTLAEVLVRVDKMAEAAQLTEQTLVFREKLLAAALPTQTETEQAATMAGARMGLGWYLYATSGMSELADSAYDHVLWLKGSIFARQVRIRQLRDNPAAAELLAEWGRVTSALATLAMRAPYADQRTAWAERVAALTADKDALERKLLALAQQNTTPPPTTADIRKVLPPDSALVDFFCHEAASNQPGSEGKASLQIRAFIIRPAQEQAVHLALPDSEKLESLIDRWRDAVNWMNSEAAKQARHDEDDEALQELATAALATRLETADAIKEHLWAPLEKHLAGAKLVIVSPDGPIAKFPLVALPGAHKGSYLLQDVAITTVAVPALLPTLLAERSVAEQYDAKTDHSLLLIGDVEYGGTAGVADLRSAQLATDATRALLPFFFGPLAGTRPEMEDIQAFFKQQFAEGKSQMITGSSANEGAFRREAPRHRWVHLATHGFYAADIEIAVQTGGINSNLMGSGSTSEADAVQPPAINHEGLKSGLALAGVNEPTGPGEDDGVLSSMEVSSMDLSGVEMAVLSACETGLGQSVSGEGVVGLQRAFQVAGARSTVTSLWPVSDIGARLLAARFYRNLWQHKLSKVEALREAQRWMIESAGKDDGTKHFEIEDLTIDSEVLPSDFSDPDFWAPFVLSGDWR